MTTIHRKHDKAGTHAILVRTAKRRYHGIGATPEAAEASVRQQIRVMEGK